MQNRFISPRKIPTNSFELIELTTDPCEIMQSLSHLMSIIFFLAFFPQKRIITK